MMSDQDIVARELRAIKLLLAADLTKDMTTNQEKILYLGKCGLAPSEIAEIVGTTVGTVSVALSKEKSKKSRTTKQSKGKSQHDKQGTEEVPS